MVETDGCTGGGGAAATRGNLLLVDNDSKIVELLSWFLGNQGFTVRVAGSFAEARERLAEGRPDLVISDVDLGVESATVELPKLSAEGLLPPTLVVSGFLDEPIRQLLLRVPEVLDSLPKPFEFPELEAKVVACLAGEVQRSLEWAPRAVQPSGFTVESRPECQSERLSATAAAPSYVPALEEDDDDEGWIEISPGG
ncbi:osmolarity response regulator [Planctomycetes bacterium Poly30]|uniref:Osmolarity response regulator n=1 Tax=Saltatorellus ferox TaxID=2528018 RepID=A0A518EWJ2_9BACT|nr:osmolarity response regulator [Planctomycetes bacterium Poly30]